MVDRRRFAFRDRLRLEELQRVTPLIDRLVERGGSILEIGAGTGAQSAELERRGYRVSAVDLAQSTYSSERVHEISNYDGVNLPYEDASFDLVFSSNVMEHVVEFDLLQQDIKRVLRPGGVCVHIVPNQFWAFFTFFGYFLLIPRKLWRMTKAVLGAGRKNKEGGSRDSKALVVPKFYKAHGVLCKYMIGEFVEFGRGPWQKRFRDCNWEVREIGRVGLFYTGHELFGHRLSFSRRASLSRVLLGACDYYVVGCPESSTVDGDRA